MVKRFFHLSFLFAFIFFLTSCSNSQFQKRQEWLRDSITPEREWWNLLHYDLSVEFLPNEKRIRGSNTISFEVLQANSLLQLELQAPLNITTTTYNNQKLNFTREGDVYWIEFPRHLEVGKEEKLTVTYEGIPKESLNPPWSGGISWGRDDLGEHYIVTTSQGIGASIWWPNKDHIADEPDRGMDIAITVPEQLVAVSNGRLKSIEPQTHSQTITYHWQVVNPINNYSVNANIGNYVNFSDTYQGLDGELTLNYWVLKHQLEKARQHFQEVPRMLEAFEYWFGPYPFYDDGFKIVSVSYAGMEHQSSVTYGNWFQNGYRGRDVSDSGVGYLFDFIIIHESGHEWFGNNITMAQPGHIWIHEGFTNYSENLFVEYWFGKEKAQDYVIGSRHNIQNDQPILTKYSAEGSSRDVYYKAGNVLHTLRHIIDDDEQWRSILIGLNTHFRHTNVLSADIENYINANTTWDLTSYFEQYLRTTDIPVFTYSISGDQLTYHLDNTVAGFSVPLKVKINNQEVQLEPTSAKQDFDFSEPIDSVEVDRNFYVATRKE